MKACLGQINTTPGDFPGNLGAIKRGIDVAANNDCDVIVFPELTIPGYLSQDLIYHPAYIDKNLSVLDEIRAYSSGNEKLHIVVGYIERNRGPGKPFFNMAAVIRNSEILLRYKKQLLPFYDVFDELRYFEPGDELAMIEIAGKRTGITICEDLWNDKGSDDYNYANNPMEQYRKARAEVVLSLNSSPWVHGKGWQRLKVIAPGTEPDITVIYVNQRGGQDELVFDGQSFVVRNGDLLHLAGECHEDTFDIVDIAARSEVSVPKVYEPRNRRVVDEMGPGLYDLLVLCLRDYVHKSGFTDLVLASSGGVDSAVVCRLACEAAGPDRVHAIRMPSAYSSEHSKVDAKQLHTNLGCWDYEVPIDHQPVIEMLNARYSRAGQSRDYNKVADENIQARMRDLYLMHFSNAYRAMPLSTGNKTESACGYYTHFDMNFGFAPIKDLYKFQVVEIAKSCPEVPENIWKKAPSAELAEGQTDESSLLPYAILDPLVRAYVEEYISTFDIFRQWIASSVERKEKISSDVDFLRQWADHTGAADDFHRIISIIGRMEYKRRQTCPGTKVTRVAFGIGRRIPIVEKWS